MGFHYNKRCHESFDIISKYLEAISKPLDWEA